MPLPPSTLPVVVVVDDGGGGVRSKLKIEKAKEREETEGGVVRTYTHAASSQGKLRL